MKRRDLSIVGLAAAAALLAAVAAHAGVEASIGGTISDVEGNRLQGVQVTVFSSEESRSDTTNKKGRFRVMVMDSTQRLMIRIEKEGYESIEEPLQVAVGEAVNKSWTMTAAAATDGVEGDSAAVEAYNAGATAFNAGDPALARPGFESALELDPDFIEARKVVTLVYFQLQEWELAASSARLVSDVELDNDAALKIGFDASSQLGDRQQAEFFLDRLVALGPAPDTAKRVFNYGVGELREGKRDAAVARFEAAIEMDPALAVAYQGLASIHLEDGVYEKALESADRLLAIDPGSAEALGIRYEAYRRMGDEVNMQAALDELQAADPDRIAEAYYQQGMLLFNEGNAEGAVSAFERVISADPEYARAYYQLGRSHLSAGDYEKGKQYLERFIAMAPDDPEVEGAREMIAYLD